MKKVLGFFVILALGTFALHLQAMEQSIEDDAIGYSWDTLPQEIKLHILSFLPAKVDKIKEFFDYSLVSSDFASLIPACHFFEIKNYRFPSGKKISINDIFFNVAKRGPGEIVRMLIERDIDVNAKESCLGYSALMHAAHFGKIETVQLLVDRGANIEAQDKHGNTALMIAVIRGHFETVKLLIDYGANIEARNSWNDTALIVATSQDTEIAKLLIDHGADIEAHNNNDDTALIMAAQFGHTEVVKLLIDHGANIEARNRLDDTALIVAASQDTEIAKLLINHRADIEAHNNDGNTVLIKAAGFGHTKMVKLLIDCIANINAQNNYGFTALTWATYNSNIKTVKLLKDELSKK